MVWKRGSRAYCEIPYSKQQPPKTLADEVKEAIKKRVDDIEN